MANVRNKKKAPSTIREYMLNLLTKAIGYDAEEFIDLYNFDIGGSTVRWWYILQDKDLPEHTETPEHTLEEFLHSEVSPEEIIIPLLHSIYAYQFIDTLVEEHTDITPEDKPNHSILEIQNQQQCFIKPVFIPDDNFTITVGPNGHPRVHADLIAIVQEFIGFDIWTQLKEEENTIGKLYHRKTNKKIDILQSLGYVLSKDNQIFNGMSIGLEPTIRYIEERMEKIGMDTSVDVFPSPITEEEIAYMVLDNLLVAIDNVSFNIPSLEIEVSAGNLYNTLFLITYVEYRGKGYSQLMMIKHHSHMKYLV